MATFATTQNKNTATLKQLNKEANVKYSKIKVAIDKSNKMIMFIFSNGIMLIAVILFISPVRFHTL